MEIESVGMKITQVHILNKTRQFITISYKKTSSQVTKKLSYIKFKLNHFSSFHPEDL